MKKSRLMCHSMQKYENNRYIAHKLDTDYFNALIQHTSVFNNDGLDALDTIPAGSMVSCGRWHAESIISRGLLAKEASELESIAESIINEILAEENNYN